LENGDSRNEFILGKVEARHAKFHQNEPNEHSIFVLSQLNVFLSRLMISLKNIQAEFRFKFIIYVYVMIKYGSLRWNCTKMPPLKFLQMSLPPDLLAKHLLFQIANMAEERAELSKHSDKVSEEIRESTLRKLKLFDSIRGKDVKESSIPFWDIVVVTAVDQKQLVAYELQIEAKLARGELPKGVVYKVVSDPSGTKIGNGGATLHAIEQLEKDLGAEFLNQCKILMLHAGGFSQRLPSASVLGKIFTAVPYGKC
jgi:hypothetical protein